MLTFDQKSLTSKTILERIFVGASAPRGCTRDEGRPLGTGLQEQVLNRLKLHG
jgi:hypothetical protein